jgi:hypothetical protein
MPFIESKQHLSLAKYAELRQAVVAFLSRVCVVTNSGLDLALQNYIDVSLFLCGVDISGWLELDDA